MVALQKALPCLCWPGPKIVEIMQSFRKAVERVIVSEVTSESFWTLWTKQEVMEIKVSRLKKQARYSVLSIRGKKFNNIWVPDAAKKE